MSLIRAVDVIPYAQSNETANDAEPNIAVNPNNPAQMVITAFSQLDSPNTNSPFFYSQDGGETWAKEYDVRAGATSTFFITNDWTVAYASTSNLLYVALLRSDNTALDVYRGSDPTAASSFTLLSNATTTDNPDQPWVSAITASQGPHSGKDCIYVGYNSGTAQAKVLVSWDAAASTTVNFNTPVVLESRSGRSDNPAVRPVIHSDGTAYAVFMSNHPGTPPTDVVVVRDDNWGTSFTDLKDPSDNQSGRIVTTITAAVLEGGERGRTGLDIQVDPSNSDTVYVCYIDSTSGTNTLSIQRSTNRGKDWSGALLSVSNVILCEVAVNSKGTIAAMYEKFISATSKWETHFQSSSDGTTWDDTLVASAADTLIPGQQPTLGDYMRLLGVGPHFYGVFPATNTPGPSIFFPNGGGTYNFLRNRSPDGNTLLKLDGTPLNNATYDPFVLKVENRVVTVHLERNPISQEEVDARRTLNQLPLQAALRVIVDGYTANELNVHGPNDKLNVPSPSGMTITCTGNVADSGAYGNGFQRFTFAYNVDFTADDSAFNFSTETNNVTITATAGTGVIQASGSAVLTLMKLPDPFILHGDPAYLSFDLRVFTVQAGQLFFSGRPWVVNSASDCPGYIKTVMQNISEYDFDNQLSTVEDYSKLYTQSTDGLGHDVFNFALAKVHYVGQNPQPFDISVFFRLFQAQSTTGQFDYTQGMPQTQPAQYRRGANRSGDIPLAGFLGGEYVTIPFFADPRIDSTGFSMTTQTDAPNRRTITPNANGSEVIQFFGCWLDFNQPTRIGKSSGLVEQNNVLPVHVPATNVDGPFTTDALPIQSLIRATHHCLIAEIDFPATPIPLGKDPSNWDKLAQRNITYSDASSATAVTTFDIKPSIPPPLPADQKPDDLVIYWGKTYADALAQIYLPAVQVSDILKLARLNYYPTTNLSRIDDHTLGCRVGGITYIPIPPASNTTGANYAGLISIEMPDGLTKGDQFDVVVKQVTNRSYTIPSIRITHPPAPPQIKLAAADTNIILWRQTVGAFQLSIPVGDKKALLRKEENDYAFLQYVASRIPQSSRWYLVFQKYVEVVGGRVTTFGGDPSTIPPSATGIKDDEDSFWKICCCCCCMQ